MDSVSSRPEIGLQGTRRPTPAQRRSLLSTLATRHIIEHGFEGVSVNDLATDLGISVGGLYRYIRTKSDLLVMACESIYGGLGDDITEIATGNELDLGEKLRAAIDLYLRECTKNREQILLMYREYRHLPPEAHQRYKEREQAVAAVFSGLISSGIRRGEFRDAIPALLATDIILLGHLPALKGWTIPSGIDDSDLRSNQIELIMSRLEGPTPTSQNEDSTGP